LTGGNEEQPRVATTRDTRTPSERIGFVGLGRMGYPMARHLAAAQLPLTAYDVRGGVTAEFCRANDATPAGSLKELGEASDVVITMLPTSKEVHAVLMGEGDGGLAHALAPGSLVVDCSSSDPLETRALGEALAERSIAMVDAPVAGGVVFAEDGTLDVFLGGRQEARERARPILSRFAKRFFECGTLGAGHAVKALNNFVNAQATITYAEALATGIKFGTDPEVMMEALRAATAGRNHVLEKKIAAQVLTRDFASGMALSLIAKDIGLARNLAAGMSMEAPVLASCLELWQRAADEIGANADQTEVVKLWERDAGVEISGG
jgi:3-hydroxyisobutyrate dehydrogenase